jgi:diguanylate cyclase (GGDEF)-like protein
MITDTNGKHLCSSVSFPAIAGSRYICFNLLRDNLLPICEYVTLILRRNMENGIQIEKPAFIDPLTGLSNRYYLNQFLPEEIKKAALNNYPLNLLMIDLDGFKKVNDTQGHLCGDKVLVQVAEIMRRTVRTTDIVVRYAGDEFIILLPGSALEKTQDICRRLLQDVEKNVFIGDKGQALHLTLSIGFAIYPTDAAEQTKLIGAADKALYLSKRRGRNGFSSAKEVTLEEVSTLAAMDAFPCPEFINQKKPFEAIQEVFKAVIQSNSRRAVFIPGSSGVGKSRLIEETKKYLKEQAAVISCVASSVHLQDPYHLFSGGIASFIDKLGLDNSQVTDIFLKIPLPESSELSLVIPQIGNIIKKPAELQVEDKNRRFLLFKGFLDFLAELNNISVVALVFDDIQWIDKASLELLRYLIQREKAKKIFIVCAFEDTKPSRESSLEDVQNLIKSSVESDNALEIKLANLSSEETAKMLEAIFPGASRANEFTSLLYDITKGNPSFIEEILKSMVENGLIFYQDKLWQVKKGITTKDIPASLDDIIKRRLKNLDEETKEMIIQAAVIGEDFQLDTLKRVGEKDEGFVSELVNRAKKMRLIDELGQEGKFNFINKRTQDILYKELNEEQRNKLHFKVAESITEQHKANLYNFAGEAAFHYSRAPQEEKSLAVSREILDKAKALFDPQELSGYIEGLVQDILAKKEKTFLPLSDAMLKQAIRFVVLLQGGIKKFRLYPPVSSVRTNTVKEIYPFLSKTFQEADTLVVSEVEKSIVINGKRPSPSQIEYTTAEHLLSVMIEHNIKTISLKAGISEEELNKFMHYLSLSRYEVAAAGGWASIIDKEGLRHIGIDEVRFTSVDEYTARSQEKQKLQDIMLAEFLLGKADPIRINKQEMIANIENNPRDVAATIMQISRQKKEEERQDEAEVVAEVIKKLNSQVLDDKKKTAEYESSLAKVILELEPLLRNKVIRNLPFEFAAQHTKIADNVFGAIPDELIVEIATDEYKNNPDNPLVVKEFIESIMVSGARKGVILTKISSKLSEITDNQEDIAFITGSIKWEALPVERRLALLLKLPSNKYSVGALEKIKSALEEMDAADKKDALEEVISQLLAKAKELDNKAGSALLGIIFNFLKQPFSGGNKDYLQMTERVNYMLESLETETQTVIFAHLLEIIKQIIDEFIILQSKTEESLIESANPLTKRFSAFVDEIFSLLLKRLKSQGQANPALAELIKAFLVNTSHILALEILFYRIVTEATKNKYDIQDMQAIMGDKVIEALVSLAMEKSFGAKDPFSAFLVRKKIAGLLGQLQDTATDKVRQALLIAKEEINVPLIELTGGLKNDSLVDPLLTYSRHHDENIRKAIIIALSEIGTAKALAALSNLSSQEQDAALRELVNAKLRKLRK